MVFSHEVEQQLLAGLLNHPKKYVEVAPYLSATDFVSDVNSVIFSFLKSDYDQGNFIDEVILSERIKLSGISFEDNINIGDYSKSAAALGWEPKISLEEMVHEMMENDINIAKRDSLAKEHGFKAPDFKE